MIDKKIKAVEEVEALPDDVGRDAMERERKRKTIDEMIQEIRLKQESDKRSSR
jgi:hypothetical protein